jgi:hypothetical protein
VKRNSTIGIALIGLVILFMIASTLLEQMHQQTNVQVESIATKPAFTPKIQLTQTPTAPPADTTPEKQFPLIRLAWFTNVPRKDDILNVLQWFDLFIFHRNEEERRDLMISMGARGPILQYLLFEAIHDPGSCTDKPNANQVAYLPGDFCTISGQHPDWFLLDKQGQRILIEDDDDTFYLMDPGNPNWRSFFLDRIIQIQEDPNWNGIFLDNVPVTLAFQEQSGYLPAAYPDDASYQTAVQGFLKYLDESYFRPKNKLLFANLVSRRDDAAWVTQLNYLDGVMHEGWAIDWPDGYRSPEAWEKQMALAEQTQDMGKTIILVSQGNRDDTTLQRFAFASYLLINHGSAFFRYANSDKYRNVWLYDDYALNLGTPLGPRYPDGETWRRDFTNGTVSVNPETHEVEINIK